jgi:hypothetical protein
MDNSNYSVKINQTEGIIEISGSDKDWIAAQLDKFAPTLSQPGQKQSGERRSAERTSEMTEAPAADASPTTAKPPRRKPASTDRAQRKPELEAKLTSDVKKALQKYVDARAGHWKSKQNQIAIIATFLLDELGWDRIDEDDLYTIYVTMGWPSPGKPRSTMDNARHRMGYFGPWSDGELQLSHKGENFGRSLPSEKN